MKVSGKGFNAEIDSPGAVARSQPDIGNVTEYGDIAAEYFPLFESTDTTGLLEGPKNDHCQSAHWDTYRATS